MEKPQGYENDLGEYGIAFYDAHGDVPIAWGFKIVNRLGEERFEALRQYGDLECNFPDWFLVVKKITFEELIEQFGQPHNIVRGPRGGFKSAMFGEKRFKSNIIKKIINERGL